MNRGRKPVMKLPLKLLILMAVVLTVAVPAGWKWAAKPKATKSLSYTFAPAAVNVPLSSTTPETSLSPDGWTWGED
jgi:hypothetical protein